jgi:uncharacterized DUF497 family protein
MPNDNASRYATQAHEDQLISAGWRRHAVPVKTAEGTVRYRLRPLTTLVFTQSGRPGFANACPGARTCIYYAEMSIEWDSRKAAGNLAKHGIDFADAATVLDDDRGMTVRDDASSDEDRFLTLGMDALGRLLVVVYTWRGDTVRLIFARQATPREQRQYGVTP